MSAGTLGQRRNVRFAEIAGLSGCEKKEREIKGTPIQSQVGENFQAFVILVRRLYAVRVGIVSTPRLSQLASFADTSLIRVAVFGVYWF